MGQIVDVPGVGKVEFPDGMTDAQIVTAINKDILPQPKVKEASQPEPKARPADIGIAAMRGLFIGGPLGAAASAASEATKQSNELMGDVAYRAGGSATDIAARYTSPETAAKIGFGVNVGTQALPTIMGGKIAESVAAPVMQSGGRALMQSALKPTFEQLRTGKAARTIQTLLDEGINPTRGGVTQLKAAISDLNDEVAGAIANSPAVINKTKAAETLRGLTSRFEKQVTPGADVKAIESAWSEFLSHPLLAGRQDIPVQLAQEIKQGTYRALGSKPYGELQGASVEAQKQLARGLKDEISAAVPGVAALNKRESELINALDVTERRVLMDLNKNPMGLALLAENPFTWAAFLADKSAAFKGIAARALYSGSQRIPQTVGMGLTGALMSQQGVPPPALYETGALYTR